MHIFDADDPEWTPPSSSPSAIRSEFAKLRKVRQNLIDAYHEEFLVNLANQATDKNSRYKPVRHVKLSIGDVVLLVDKYCKPSTYPLGLVQSVETNSLGEVTAARVLKGNTGEVVYRHSTSLILLITNDSPTNEEEFSTSKVNPISEAKGRVSRKAAMRAKSALKVLADENNI